MKKHLVLSLCGMVGFIGNFILYGINGHSTILSNVLLFGGIFLLAMAYKDFNNIKIRETLRQEIARNKAKQDASRREK